MNSYGSAPLRVLLDSATRIAAIDGQLARELGHDTAELLDAPFSTLLAPEAIEPVGEAFVALVRGENELVTLRVKLRTADGDAASAVLSAEPRQSRGAFVGFAVAVLLDDERLSLPASLPDHLRRLRAPAALINSDGALIDTNLAWGQLFATADAVTPGGDIHDLVHADDREAFDTPLGELQRGATTSMRIELRCLREDGPFWCRLSVAPLDTRSGDLVITAEDISEEHLTNRVLLANEALFRSLAESSPVGLARLTPDLTISYSSPSWRRMTGEQPDDPHADIGDLLHPDGRAEAVAALRSRIEAGSSEPVVARLADSDRGATWVSLRIGPVPDDDVGTIGHVITIEDVTELVAANESQSQLAGIVESTSDLVGIADLVTGRVLYLNAAAAQLFAPDGLGELTVSDVYTPESLARYQDEVYPVLRRGETWTGELEMRRHDGTLIRVLQTVAPEVGPDDEPIRVSTLGRDVSDQREALDELAYKATHDALTGLPNRSLLIDHLELALARSARDNRPVAVLFVDLDRFKAVNDTFGHAAGDKLLQELAERMAAVLRPSDTVARLGGDEFVVLCEDIEGEFDAVAIAERVRTAIEGTPIRVNGNELTISASIGIAISNGPASRDSANLLQRADAAMYRAKDGGRARTELFDDVRRDRTKRRAEQREQLEQAIDDGALDVHYQPIVDLRTGRVRAVEALVRWLHPASGLLGPSEFLPLAIETGLVARLDALVIERACQDAARWFSSLGPRSPAVHVNIDGSTLDGELTTRLEACLNASSMDPSKLCLELSEAFLMANGDSVVDQLAGVTGLGVALAIDDVGTGAMQLPRLRRFDLSLLKLDGSVTEGLEAEASTRQLVRGIVSLADALEISVAAEWVETRSAVPVLRELGVDLAQGHVFSAALPAAKVEPLLTLRSTIAREDR